MLNLSERTYHRLMLGVLTIVSILVICTFRQYGITWDEELQSQYGLAVVDYYQSLFHDDRYQEIFNLYLYGGMFDGLASVFSRLTPYTVYETRHFLNAVFGVLGLWGTWRLGRYMGGGAVGLLAMVMLALTPMYYGHMFNNPKDIPFACGIVWTIFYMARSLDTLPNPKRDTLIKLSVIYGFTLGIRVGGAMLITFWLLMLGIYTLRPMLSGMPFRTVFNNGLQLLWRVALPVIILFYGIMLLCWPWAQQHPITNVFRALGEFSNFPQDVEVLLDGTIYRSTQLPWTYVPFYFGIQLPEFLLVSSGLMLLISPLLFRSLPYKKKLGAGVMALMAMVPILYACIRHPALYDAVRHFIFVIPLLCVASAYALVFIMRWAINEFEQRRSRILIASGFGIIGLIIAMAQIAIMIHLHPYEYIFANRFAGGVHGIYGKYELDYWGSSFKEAAERLQAKVNAEGGVPSGKIYRIAICGPWDAAMIYMPPDYRAVVANEPAEFFLSTTRWMCQNMRPGKEIIRVERDGVPLSIIKDLRD